MPGNRDRSCFGKGLPRRGENIHGKAPPAARVKDTGLFRADASR